ncbi:MAG: MaoC/PaaZ C-terminal domain-containing protein [Acidimicrobiales bacterium]
MAAAPLDRLGRVYEQEPVEVDAARALAYARATNDDNPAYLSGDVLPPLFGVVPAWPAFLAVVGDLVPPDSMSRLLHAGHDMRFHRPLVAGSRLATSAEVSGVRAARAGAWISVRLQSRADGGPVALEQFATLFVRGLDAGGSGGVATPGHPFPPSARSAPVATFKVDVDFDQTSRYAEASGDTNAIHLDEAAAKAAGLPGVIVHGLCTMAMCGRAVVAAAAGDDPTRLKRLALRFSQPVLPGSDVSTSVYGAGTDEGARNARYAFEATSGEKRVVKDGLAEVAA